MTSPFHAVVQSDFQDIYRSCSLPYRLLLYKPSIQPAKIKCPACLYTGSWRGHWQLHAYLKVVGDVVGLGINLQVTPSWCKQLLKTKWLWNLSQVSSSSWSKHSDNLSNYKGQNWLSQLCQRFLQHQGGYLDQQIGKQGKVPGRVF